MTTESKIDRVLGNAPWWMISAGIHVVLILTATLVCVERLMAVEPEGITSFVNHTQQPTIDPVAPSPDLHQPPGVDNGDPSIVATDSHVYENPFAEWSDHDESDNNQLTHEVLGDSMSNKGYIPGSSTAARGNRPNDTTPGSNDIMGTGPGGGGPGAFGGRIGGGKWLKKRPGQGKGGTPEEKADDAVLAALKWLARHQESDGSWGPGKCIGETSEDFRTGTTGLSLLAFLGAGFSHLSKDEFPDAISGAKFRFGEVVKKGVQWLVNHQDPEGCVGPRVNRYMYNHAIGTLALCEAFGMSNATVVENPAQKAVDFLVAAQNPGRGWRYSSRCGDNDTSVTGWAVMALKSAELSGMRFPRSAFESAIAWLNEATESTYYRTGYNAKNTGKVFVPGKNEKFAGHDSMTAVSVLSHIFINKQKDKEVNAVQELTRDLPEWSETKIDAYYWYYGSLALFQYDGPSGALWTKWNSAMVNTLVPHQDRGGCEDGSWNPAVDRWGVEAGRVYTTAINALTLEVYYRYKNVFGAK